MKMKIYLISCSIFFVSSVLAQQEKETAIVHSAPVIIEYSAMVKPYDKNNQHEHKPAYELVGARNVGSPIVLEKTINLTPLCGQSKQNFRGKALQVDESASDTVRRVRIVESNAVLRLITSDQKPKNSKRVIERVQY